MTGKTFAKKDIIKNRTGGKTKSAPGPRTRQSKEQYDRFIAEYRIDRNGARAATFAGYSEKTAAQQAYDLLRIPYVQGEISRLDFEDQKRYGLTRERVLKELSRIVFFNPKNLFDKNGKLKPISAISDDDAAALTGIDHSTVISGRGSHKETEYIKKLRFQDKGAAIEKAMKYLGLLGKETSLFAEFEAAFIEAMAKLPEATRNEVFVALKSAIQFNK